MEQLRLNLFEPLSPTWEDVYKGRARYHSYTEPCDKCEGKEFNIDGFWHEGKCWHNKERYAYPKQQPNGMCRKGTIVWCD